MNANDKLTTLIIGETGYQTTLTRKFEQRTRYVQADVKTVRCVIPGLIQKIYVHQGSSVARNEPLLVLEAMKMQNDILSPEAGTVKAVHVKVGQMVTKGHVLLELD